MGRTAAVGGIGEHVVDQEAAADADERRPPVEIVLRGLHRVPAVDEDEVDLAAPHARAHRRPGDDPDDGLLEIGVEHRLSEPCRRVERAGMRVDQRGVVILPTGLVLLGAAVVVDGGEKSTVCLGDRAQEHRRLSAVRSDLDAQTDRIRLCQKGTRCLVEAGASSRARSRRRQGHFEAFGDSVAGRVAEESMSLIVSGVGARSTA